MQLDRLVQFHKTLADPTRIRILSLLAQGPLHGQALAGKLGLTPSTITHHVQKLREVGLVFERRNKNTLYLHLDAKALQQKSQAITKWVNTFDKKERGELEQNRWEVIRNFFTADGKLTQLPAKHKKKLIVLEYLIKDLKVGVKYPENELNEYIKKFHDDYATIRGELIINHFMYRENGIYELNSPDMWKSF
ncbi:ArsR family transcriptional regulator [Laceyella sacchari]|nr:ArsR family transcriptional regulator [Laceyella sacchari]